MRRAIASVLMMTLLLLPGCGEREVRAQESFDALRAAVTAARDIRFQAALTADWGETTAEYTVEAAYDGQKTTLQILTPDILAGVKASVQRGETSVDYDGVILDTGPLDQEGLTPMSAIPVVLDALASAYVELLWWDGDALAARLYVGEQSVATVWMKGAQMAPVAAEIATDGKTVITCRIENWQIS